MILRFHTKERYIMTTLTKDTRDTTVRNGKELICGGKAQTQVRGSIVNRNTSPAIRLQKKFQSRNFQLNIYTEFEFKCLTRTPVLSSSRRRKRRSLPIATAMTCVACSAHDEYCKYCRTLFKLCSPPANTSPNSEIQHTADSTNKGVPVVCVPTN